MLQEIQNLIMQPHYPCVSAVSAFLKKDLMISEYTGFGSGEAASSLYNDLILFKERQKKTKAPFYSFWAVYKDSSVETEEGFERKLWAELSAVHAFEVDKLKSEGGQIKWDPQFSADPEDKKFCFCADGEAYFIVGVHPVSSRKARQFPYPALIFNLYTQFEDLMKKNSFEPMVKTNRQREIRFQGDVNPMVEKYGQNWESIQFSGRNNSESWGCPFLSLIKKAIS